MSIVLKALLLLLVPAAGQVPATPTELPATAATDASASLAKSAAEDEAEEAADTFGEKHDTDSDGKLSMKEAVVGAVDAEAVKKAFTAADVNADTFLEPNELSKFLASVQGGANAQSFLQVEEQDEETEEDEEAEDDEEEDEDEDDEDDEEEVEVKKAVLADTDEDGKLTMQEVMDASGEDLAIVRNACETADVNDDRVIDADELPTLMKALQGGEALLQRVEQEDEEDEEEVEVKKAVLADADEDGKLTMQEVMDASGEDFAIVRKACETADVNDDQFIDADELPKLMKALNDEQEM